MQFLETRSDAKLKVTMILIMVRDTSSSKHASTHQIRNSYLK